MKTTIDIPEPLYRKAKIRAAENGTTLKQIVLTSLDKELGTPVAPAPPDKGSFMARRRLLPEFAKFEAEGAFTPGAADRDITELICQDRDGR